MSIPSSSRPELARLVEKQMRNWELGRAQRSPDRVGRNREVEDFVTLSRSVGLDGSALARALGKALGWPVFDKEILQAMAGDSEVRRRLYAEMDERDLSWFEETLQGLTTGHSAPNDYFTRLTRTVLSLARHGNAVFLGRAADLILPRHIGLRVRLVASADSCIQEHARSSNLSPREAGSDIIRIEHDRANFIANHFKIADDATRYDLTINLDYWSIDHSVELIVTARQLRERNPITTAGAQHR